MEVSQINDIDTFTSKIVIAAGVVTLSIIGAYNYISPRKNCIRYAEQYISDRLEEIEEGFQQFAQEKPSGESGGVQTKEQARRYYLNEEIEL